MKKKLFGIIASTVLVFTSVAVIAPATGAQATTVVSAAKGYAAAPLYKCRKYNWFIGWRTVYTTDWRSYQNDGWQCYCIAP